MQDATQDAKGYLPCACRDCFELTVGGELCSLCEDAGCDAEGESECEGEHSYCSGDDEGAAFWGGNENDKS